MPTPKTPAKQPVRTRPRRSQAERRAQTRAALLDAAALGLARHGFANLNLADVAADAGYSRGALYHLFADKEALALAAIDWVLETWAEDVGSLEHPDEDPVDLLVALARAHVAYCRDGRARLMLTLRVEFAERDHPVGNAINHALEQLRRRNARLVARGRAEGRIPAGPPEPDLVAAYMSAVEGAAIGLAGQTPHDEELTERIVRGLLGVPA